MSDLGFDIEWQCLNGSFEQIWEIWAVLYNTDLLFIVINSFYNLKKTIKFINGMQYEMIFFSVIFWHWHSILETKCGFQKIAFCVITSLIFHIFKSKCYVLKHLVITYNHRYANADIHVSKTVEIQISWLLRSQLIRIHSVFYYDCKYILISEIQQVNRIKIEE